MKSVVLDPSLSFPLVIGHKYMRLKQKHLLLRSEIASVTGKDTVNSPNISLGPVTRPVDPFFHWVKSIIELISMLVPHSTSNSGHSLHFPIEQLNSQVSGFWPSTPSLSHIASEQAARQESAILQAIPWDASEWWSLSKLLWIGQTLRLLSLALGDLKFLGQARRMALALHWCWVFSSKKSFIRFCFESNKRYLSRLTLKIIN